MLWPVIFASLVMAVWGVAVLRLFGMRWRWALLTAAALAAGVGWSAFDAIS